MENLDYLILGCGVWGLSTAWWIIKDQPDAKILCLDKWEVPSLDSAGYDINKVISAKYGSDLDNYTSLLAFEAWENPIFKAVYHKTGMLGVADDNPEALEYVTKAYNKRVENNYGENVEWCENIQSLVRKFPLLKDSNISGWKGYFDALGGWVHASKAMKIIYEECLKKGVKFKFGDSGTVSGLEIREGKLVSVKCEDGSLQVAPKIIMCLGAYTELFLDMNKQTTAKCWSLVHLKVSPEEARSMRNSPILFNFQRGFFFEPDENLCVKVVNEFPGFTNYEKVADGRTISVPRSNGIHPNETIPDKCRDSIRDFLKRAVPFLADREFVYEKLCWCSDSNDKRWIISRHPQFKNLTVATGDSGLGFKMLPIIGSFIKDVSDGTSLPEVVGDYWSWKNQESSASTKVERWGLDNVTEDLKSQSGWRA